MVGDPCEMSCRPARAAADFQHAVGRAQKICHAAQFLFIGGLIRDGLLGIFLGVPVSEGLGRHRGVL